MTATIGARAALSSSRPRALFPIVATRTWVDYDVAPDGRFLAVVPDVIAHQHPVTVVLDWIPVE